MDCKQGKAGGAPRQECMMPRLLSPKTPRIVSGLPGRWSLSGYFFQGIFPNYQPWVRKIA
ncbi:hypothetical protein D3C75_498810 [compost metagenome]